MEVFRHDPESARTASYCTFTCTASAWRVFILSRSPRRRRKTMSLAREAEYPLLVTVEPE